MWQKIKVWLLGVLEEVSENAGDLFEAIGDAVGDMDFGDIDFD